MKQTDLFKPDKQTVIALVSSKGGCGKSTLSACLAVEMAKEATVYLLDLDPQQSSARWWRRRQGPQNPLLITGVESLTRAKEKLKAKQADRDYLVCDSPGSFVGVISDTIAAADVVVVVVQPSPKDIEAQGVVEECVAKSGKQDCTLYVMNRTDGRSPLRFDAAARLQTKSSYPPFMVTDLKDYVRADVQGKTGPELNSVAQEEIRSLWHAIRGIAANGQHRKRIRSDGREPGQSGNKEPRRGKGQRTGKGAKA